MDALDYKTRTKRKKKKPFKQDQLRPKLLLLTPPLTKAPHNTDALNSETQKIFYISNIIKLKLLVH